MEIGYFVVVILALLGGFWYLANALKSRTDEKKPEDNQGLVLLQNQERFERSVREEIGKNREEARISSKSNREEIAGTLKLSSDSITSRITEVANSQSGQLANLIQSNEQKLEKMREVIERKLSSIQEDNAKKLEQMRITVDEKLHATLEKRLGESFKLVGERLELVQKGLGEMQSIATGVGDLKKVLSNVKNRGILGEAQLGSLLEEILTPDQYEKNVSIKKGSSERVEFAIKFPQDVLLPIDSKFPIEDYQRLIEAEEKGDLELIAQAGKALEIRIKSQAKEIKEKYIDPPRTTSFAVLFLPFESLYAEVLRRPGLYEQIRQDYGVVIAGPTNTQAILNALQMGFQTLTIQKRSSEVWVLLGAVKTEFSRFAGILDKTHKKLQEASNTIEDAARKTRHIETKLRKVQELPEKESMALLGTEHADDETATIDEAEEGS